MNSTKILDLHKELSFYKDKFKELKGNYRFSRLGKCFKTKKNKYFYDSGTGAVYQIENNVYKVLETLAYKDEFESLLDLDIEEDDLINALDIIKDSVKKNNILLSPVIVDMECPNIDDLCEDGFPVSQVTLELTERCNLRCKYCIYQDEQGGFRTFGEKNMTFDTVKRVIDFLSNSPNHEVYVTFYGGEPLLQLELIKKCVDYCKKVLIDKDVNYNMTTNATLITKEVAEYISTLGKHFTTVSLDGPEEIHDSSRVFSNGDGSFDKTITGLKNLIKAEGVNALENININVVLADKHSHTYEAVQNFFESQEWLPKGIEISTSYVDTGSVEFKYLGVDTEEDLNFTKNSIEPGGEDAIDPINHWYFNKVKESGQSLENSDIISKQAIDRGLHLIHARIITEKPVPRYGMNGCCTPAARRLYITADGEFKLCEKMGPSPSIGDVHKGIDLNKIKKYYIEDYIRESKVRCNDCWAIRLCSLCYLDCYDKKGIHMSYRNAECLFNRRIVEQNLIRYHEILENNPESLNYLNSISYS